MVFVFAITLLPFVSRGNDRVAMDRFNGSDESSRNKFQVCMKKNASGLDLRDIGQLTGRRWTVLPWYIHATTEHSREWGATTVHQHQYQATLQQGLFPTFFFQTSILLIPFHE